MFSQLCNFLSPESIEAASKTKTLDELANSPFFSSENFCNIHGLITNIEKDSVISVETMYGMKVMVLLNIID